MCERWAPVVIVVTRKKFGNYSNNIEPFCQNPLTTSIKTKTFLAGRY